MKANLTLIRQLMKKQNISVNALSNELGLTLEHVSYVLNGHRNLTQDNLKKIAKVLEVNIAELYEGTDKRFVKFIEKAILEQTLSEIEISDIRELQILTDLAVRFGILEESQEIKTEDTEQKDLTQIFNIGVKNDEQ